MARPGLSDTDSYHAYTDTRDSIVSSSRAVTYRFSDHFHPYVAQLARKQAKSGIRGLEEADTARADGGRVLENPEDAELYDSAFFGDTYDPNPDAIRGTAPVKDIDFACRGAYSVYNWELFFHVPIAIATHLSRSGRFQEAMRWLHLLFDPTDDTDEPTPQRFWRVKPFQLIEIKRIEHILVNLATADDVSLRDETLSAINEWKDKPFRPHVIARGRQSAYMYKTVMTYLDNLISWGDHLFRQDTRETINEALQLYVLAANLLGPRPQETPRTGEPKPKSYADIREQLAEFGTILEHAETTLPFDTFPTPGPPGSDSELAALRSIGNSLYFCVPRNDKLLGYWDTVADRLFKLRNSLSIRGVFRQLPVFEPPIDPAMLARAAAAGLDVSAVIAGLDQPLPLIRFRYLIQIAIELATDVKALGASVLSTMEKEDSEALAILRASHERAMLDLTESVRYSQWQEAIKSREAIERSLEIAVRRYIYYERLFGVEEDGAGLPQMEDLDVQQLIDGRLRSDEPDLTPRDIEIRTVSGLGEAAGHFLSPEETLELSLQNAAEQPLGTATVLDAVTAMLHYLPTFTTAGHPAGVGLDVTWGTANITGYLSALSGLMRSAADTLHRRAGRVGRVASYSRREQEWSFQSSLVAGEIAQIHKQLRAAQIREFITQREYETHRRQMAQADEIERFLTDERRGKTTNRDFYTWIRREIQALHAQTYQLAFDVAKKAERALQHEVGDPSLTYLKYNYAAGKQGLLAGEKLHLDLKRMEIAYHDQNRREYELTKHVSLLQLDPYALLQLRLTGSCTFNTSEELFDFDGPGHYFRRINTVALSIPSVTGPYVGVNCNLRLTKSTVRKRPQLTSDPDPYARTGPEDPRFDDHYGSLDAVVTSSGQADTGLFEANLKDERYLPFEGSGVIGEWQLQLPADPSRNDPAQFDYQTISDVILHIRYTAREGGDSLRTTATTHLGDLIEQAETVGSIRMLSIRHEFPNAWADFKSAVIDDASPRAPLTLELRSEHYPFWSRGRLDELKSVTLIARTESSLEISDTSDPTDPAGNTDTLSDTLLPAVRQGELESIALPPPTGSFTLHLGDNSIEDLWVATRWGTS